MGTLANSLFRGTLGWMRVLCAQIWASADSPEEGTLLIWIGENWKVLALGLCAIGLVIDLIVYLFRWQPYRVWHSFFHRKERLEEEKQFDAAESAGDAEYAEQNAPEYEPEYEEEAYGAANEQEESLTPSFEQAIRPARRRRVREMFSDDSGQSYARPEEVIDQYAAYRKPVYPRSWKADEGDEE